MKQQQPLVLCYILMNKHHPVLEFLYDSATHHVLKLQRIIDPAYAPPAILDRKGSPTRVGLDRWWRNRAIPITRANHDALLYTLSVDSTLALCEKSLGLSLSDRYWICEKDHPQEWAAVNFFDNDFSPVLGYLTLGLQPSGDCREFMSPNATLNGDLNKSWIITDGQRILLKSGSGFVNQEVYNEVIATCLHSRLLAEEDYVPYSLQRVNRRTYSACPNMLREDEELVPAYAILQNQKQSNSQNDYQFLVTCLEKLGLSQAERFLSKMFVCDYILGNFDRHYQNFGVIRNVETLSYTRFAPIFDSGSSLWCNTALLETPRDYAWRAKPFGYGMRPEKQLALLSSCDWFKPERLAGFAQEVAEILAQNPAMTGARIACIEQGVARNIESVTRLIDC